MQLPVWVGQGLEGSKAGELVREGSSEARCLGSVAETFTLFGRST